jgi:hypothetical protein
MAHAAFDVETTAPPERVREALLDFSERRPEIWPGIDASLYEVYSVGEAAAEIKEGTKAPGMTAWARERYDWSQPDTIRWTVVESNFCEPGSFVEATLRPREDGGTRIHVEWDRTGTTRSGKLAIGLIARSGGRPVARSLRKGLERLERAATA